jgi:cell division transport system ATP-binding protein
LIQLSNVSFNTDGNQILSDISLTVNPGEFVCIVGPSGAGKSTILRLVHMEIFPTGGNIRIADYLSNDILPREIPFFRRKVGVVFQDFKLLEDRDVFENVAFALWATGVKRRRINKRVFQVLAEVGLSHKRYARIHELSGGEQQRVAIARALANEPFVLLADEPTGNLDPDNTEEILSLFKRINSRGMAILMATHKASLVETLPARMVSIKEGRMAD